MKKLELREVGLGSERAKELLQKIASTTSDSRKVFNSLENDISNQIKEEFSSSNPNQWPDVTSEWQARKSELGGGDVIGVFTGELKQAASDDAIKNISANTMIWEIADVNSIYFTIKRPVGGSTREWLVQQTQRILDKIMVMVRR